MPNHIIESLKTVKKILGNKFDKNSRIAIIGIGNELRHDDIAGLEVVRNLIKEFQHRKPFLNIHLLEGEDAPLSKVHEIIDWNPTDLIMLDAGELNSEPGTIELMKKEEIFRFSTSSHSGSKSILLDFLTVNIPNLEIIIIAIQVEKIIFERGISEKVKQAVEELTKMLIELLFE